MSDQAVAARPPSDSALETSARELGQFVIRVMLLPVTLLFTKPRKIAEASAAGHYRPLPSPYLLALITGIVVSGVTANVEKIGSKAEAGTQATAENDFFTALVQFYTNMDGVRSILFAIPYIAFVWIAAGLTSIVMLRGIRSAEMLFAGLSFCLSAMVAITAYGLMVALLLAESMRPDIQLLVGLAFAFFVVILSVKLVRLIFVARKESQSNLIGAILASLPALLIVWLGGLVAGTVLIAALNSAGAATPIDHRQLAQSALRAGRADEAIAAYDRALRFNPGAQSLYIGRAEAFELKGDRDRALADYDRAIKLVPASGYYRTLRGGLYSTMGRHDEALADYDLALDYEPTTEAYYRGRCFARLRAQRMASALSDCEEALRLVQSYYDYNSTFGFGRKAEAFYSRGVANLAAAHYDRALQDFDQALASSSQAGQSETANETLGRIRYGKGVALSWLGRDAESRAEISAASSLYVGAPASLAQFGAAAAPRSAATPRLAAPTPSPPPRAP